MELGVDFPALPPKAASEPEMKDVSNLLLSTLYDLRDVRNILKSTESNEATSLLRTEAKLRAKAQQLTGI